MDIWNVTVSIFEYRKFSTRDNVEVVELQMSNSYSDERNVSIFALKFSGHSVGIRCDKTISNMGYRHHLIPVDLGN